MPDTEKTQKAENFEVTMVMDAAQKNTTSLRSVTQLSDIIEGKPRVIDSGNLQADSSAEFRRQLENTGKRYKILKMIAEGGFGKIFLAKDLVLGREVVIKSLKTEHLAKPASIEKFISEAKLSAQLDHPAIVPLFSLDTDTVDGLHLAMQLINGITLKEFLNRCREKDQCRHAAHIQQIKICRMGMVYITLDRQPQFLRFMLHQPAVFVEEELAAAAEHGPFLYHVPSRTPNLIAKCCEFVKVIDSLDLCEFIKDLTTNVTMLS